MSQPWIVDAYAYYPNLNAYFPELRCVLPSPECVLPILRMRTCHSNNIYIESKSIQHDIDIDSA